jgi:hypothetical protein
MFASNFTFIILFYTFLKILIVLSLSTIVPTLEIYTRRALTAPTRSYYVKLIIERLSANFIFKDLKKVKDLIILWCKAPGRRKRRKVALYNSFMLIRVARFGLRRKRGVKRHYITDRIQIS